jgi:hypothetical protein
MEQTLTFRSSDINIKYKFDELKVHIEEDDDLVLFFSTLKRGAGFNKKETINICKKTLKNIGGGINYESRRIDKIIYFQHQL